MLNIQPAADGRLRISNNHRSELARDLASARTLAYAWGHTDISINKALAEMKAAGTSNAPARGWRVARAEPARVEIAAPVAERRAPPARKSAAKASSPAAEAVAKRAVKQKPAPEKKAPAQKKPASREKAAAKPAPADPRARALSLFQAGARELAALERDTLPFARGPWTELRQMAEHIAACLEGKKQK